MADISHLISFQKLTLSQGKLPCLRLQPCPGGSPHPVSSQCKTQRQPHYLLEQPWRALLAWSSPWDPFKSPQRWSQSHITPTSHKCPGEQFTVKLPRGVSVSLLFPSRPHLSRNSERAAPVLTLWRCWEGGGIKTDGSRKVPPAAPLFPKLASVPPPGPGVPAPSKEAL